MTPPRISTRGRTRKTHGRSHDRTYRSWRSAKGRCFNPRSVDHQHYGGRGITMCDRWAMSFEAFLADMGDRPERTSLDRIDPNGNYEPSNCRWASQAEQIRNKATRGFKLSAEQAEEIRGIGRSMSSRAIGAKFGVSHSVIQGILNGKYWIAPKVNELGAGEKPLALPAGEFGRFGESDAA